MKYTNSYGTIYYLNDKGEYHRVNGPAIIFPDGREIYYLSNIQYNKTEYDEYVLDYLDKIRSVKLKTILKNI
jgi:hypothetical protein